MLYSGVILVRNKKRCGTLKNHDDRLFDDSNKIRIYEVIKKYVRQRHIENK